MRSTKRAAISAAAIAIIVGAAVVGMQRYWASYRVNCDHADKLLLRVDKKPGAELDSYFSRLKFVDGIPRDEYGRENPFTIAMVGLLDLQRYCETKEPKRLEVAIRQRKVLVDNIKRSNSGTDALLIKYDFPNAPYAEKAGWSSAMSQSAGTLLMMLLQPEGFWNDQKLITGTIRPALHDIDHGGIYSNFEDGSIFWEEVAYPDRPSIIMNGAQVATHNYDIVIDLMPPGDPMRVKLHELNERAKDGLMLVQDRMIKGDGKGHILYDLTTVPMNIREKGHYAHLIAIEWLEEMKAQGRDVKDYIERLKAL